ncbi:MAG: hypothetical protein ACJ76S_01700 [Solirubrobacteraceae bacterium]
MRVLRRLDRRAAVACAIGLITLTGCGAKSQDVGETSGTFTVDVVRASFPTQQRLAQKSQLVITVRNPGGKTIPDVAVTVEPVQPNSRFKAQAFQESSAESGLADPSRPVWTLDAGPRGGITAYTNTWALGRLRPGEVKTFLWRVTAVKAGVHEIKYTVAAGLNGKAKARLPGGELPTGSFRVNISGAPAEGRLGPGDQPIR